MYGIKQTIESSSSSGPTFRIRGGLACFKDCDEHLQAVLPGIQDVIIEKVSSSEASKRCQHVGRTPFPTASLEAYQYGSPQDLA